MGSLPASTATMSGDQPSLFRMSMLTRPESSSFWTYTRSPLRTAWKNSSSVEDIPSAKAPAASTSKKGDSHEHGSNLHFHLRYRVSFVMGEE